MEEARLKATRSFTPLKQSPQQAMVTEEQRSGVGVAMALPRGLEMFWILISGVRV